MVYPLTAFVVPTGYVGLAAAVVCAVAAMSVFTVRLLQRLVRSRTAEVQRLLVEAEAASRAKGQFLANMSHEIRTPMHGILGLTELLLASPLNAEQKHCAGLIHDAATSLLELLNNILDVSKLEAGRLVFEAAPFSPRQVLLEATGLWQYRAESKGVAFELAIDSSVPEAVCCDRVRFRQIVTNLVSNAVKFTDRGSVAVRARAEHRGPGGVQFRIEVADSGVGIDPAQQDRLFRRFEQADPSTTRKYGGTGLGLAIAKQLVESMGGAIGVESTPGVGSTFWVTLTLQCIGLAGNAGAEGGDPVVLVVEDHPVNQLLARRLLEKAGYAVSVAADGRQAIVCLQQSHFDAILMDVQMPEIDGLQVTAQIRALERGVRHTPIIAMTASAMEGDRERCLQAGMDDYVTKPISAVSLQAALERWVRRRAI